MRDSIMSPVRFGVLLITIEFVILVIMLKVYLF